MGGALALSLEQQYKKEGNNPYGIIQSKTFGSPTVSSNLVSSLGKVGKSISKNSILYLGVAWGLYADSAIGFADGGLITKLSADIANDMDTRLTSDNNTSPDRTRYFGDPINVFEFNAKTGFPSFKQRYNISAHSYSGLQIADQVETRDTPKNPLTQSPDDNKAEVITY